jgi:hypothetical protein
MNGMIGTKALFPALALTLALACDKSTPNSGVAAKEPAASATASEAPALTAVKTAEATPSATAEPPPVASTALSTPSAAVADAGKAKAGAVAGGKPVSKHITGSNFALDVASPGCKAGEDCAITLKLLPAADYHVNKEYPYKFIATPTSGITFLGKSDANTFAKATGDYAEQGEKASTMTVRFKPTSAGEAHVAGKYKLSVCSAAQCQIEEQPVDLAVPVM